VAENTLPADVTAELAAMPAERGAAYRQLLRMLGDSRPEPLSYSGPISTPLAAPDVPPCRYHDGPSCWALLVDPEWVLADRSHWPQALCIDMLSTSTRGWARQHVRQALAPLTWGSMVWAADRSRGARRAQHHWPYAWPLPVGRLALTASPWIDPTDELRPLWASLPFDAEECAWLAWRLPLASGWLDLLVLEWQPGDPTPQRAPGAVPLGRLAIRLQTPGAAWRSAVNLVEQAEEWLNGFRGRLLSEIVKTHRLEGTAALDHWPLEGLRDDFHLFLAERRLDRLPFPKKQDFARRYDGISVSTLERRLRDFGHTWGSFLAYCEQMPRN
jgi:hypothetical protein